MTLSDAGCCFEVESTSGKRSREADAAAASYARLKTELVAESTERVALREKNKRLSALEHSEYEALQNLQHEVAAEADEVTALRQEVRDARQEAAASPKKARESQRAREDLLKSELEELEVTLKKVRADLRRSQEVATFLKTAGFLLAARPHLVRFVSPSML